MSWIEALISGESGAELNEDEKLAASLEGREEAVIDELGSGGWMSWRLNLGGAEFSRGSKSVVCSTFLVRMVPGTLNFFDLVARGFGLVSGSTGGTMNTWGASSGIDVPIADGTWSGRLNPLRPLLGWFSCDDFDRSKALVSRDVILYGSGTLKATVLFASCLSTV